MSTAPLLIEIGCEEVPAGVIGGAARWLGDQIQNLLSEGRDAGELPGLTVLSTPRRMVVHVAQVVLRQADRQEIAMGPAVAVAKQADGSWSKAAEGFARGQGVAVGDLEISETPKGPYLAARKHIAGRDTAELLAEALPRLLRQMPLPKRMRWGAEREAFVRPIHWLVALLGDQPVDFAFAGVNSGRQVGGHRFYHPGMLDASSDLEQHKQRLRAAKVLLDPAEREQVIRRGIKQLSAEAGGNWRQDDKTLEVVVQLVEWPAPLLGTFDPAYLEIPPEVIFTTLRENQKLFTVDGGDGKVLNRFIAVANTLSEESREIVAAGNARVVSARLSDARFFYREDVKLRLQDRVAGLDERIWLAGMGSIGDKTRRIRALAGYIAAMACPEEAQTVERAAELCKTDLATKMVFEFPEVQGIIGGYYAREDGETAGVALAIREHYQPRFADDAPPSSPAGVCLSLADRLDSLVACFAMGLKPSGSQDPYALRRAAIGVLRTLQQWNWSLDIALLVRWAVEGLPAQTAGQGGKVAPAEVLADALEFLKTRQKVLLTAEEGGAAGVDGDVADAVLAAEFAGVPSAVARAKALQAMRQGADFAPLAAAFKRVANLVKKSADEGDMAAPFDPALCEKDVERALQSQVHQLGALSQKALETGDYASALTLLSQVKPQVDAFFDGVLVIADDEAVRRNRLALLRECAGLFAQVADFSRLQG